jgi:hypothetical protein
MVKEWGEEDRVVLKNQAALYLLKISAIEILRHTTKW